MGYQYITGIVQMRVKMGSTGQHILSHSVCLRLIYGSKQRQVK